MRRAEQVELWRRKVKEVSDPWYAKADTTLRPENIDTQLVGHHLSVPFEHGVRTYVFSGQKNRDRFVNKYRPFGAKACGDPLKD